MGNPDVCFQCGKELGPVAYPANPPWDLRLGISPLWVQHYTEKHPDNFEDLKIEESPSETTA